jgi:hypothetical protein
MEFEEQQLQSSYDSFQLQGIEWGKYSSKACIWHMMSMKAGEWKVKSMMRDGVWLLGNLTQNISTGDKSAANNASVIVHYKVESSIFVFGALSECLFVFLAIVVIWCVYTTSKVRL